MPLPYSYLRNFEKIITDKNSFITNLKKLLPNTQIHNQNGELIFTLNKALLPFNYDVKITFKKQKIQYEVNLINLFFIDFLFSILLLFIIKDIVKLLFIITLIFVFTYAVNIFHINIVLEYLFNQAIDEQTKITCPSCKLSIPQNSTKCPHCGYHINNDDSSQTQIRYIIKK